MTTPPFDPRPTPPPHTAPLPGDDRVLHQVTGGPPQALWSESVIREAQQQFTPALDLQIRDCVAKGYRVTYRDDWTAQLTKGGETSHILHLLLTLITVGLWSVVWILLAIKNRKRTVTVTS